MKLLLMELCWAIRVRQYIRLVSCWRSRLSTSTRAIWCKRHGTKHDKISGACWPCAEAESFCDCSCSQEKKWDSILTLAVAESATVRNWTVSNWPAARSIKVVSDPITCWKDLSKPAIKKSPVVLSSWSGKNTSSSLCSLCWGEGPVQAIVPVATM